jgi:hypothetical protein
MYSDFLEKMYCIGRNLVRISNMYSYSVLTFPLFLTVWRTASISSQGEGSAPLGTSAFIYMHTLMEQRQMWGHHFVSDGTMPMVKLMFCRWVFFAAEVMKHFATMTCWLDEKYNCMYFLFVSREVVLFKEVGCSWYIFDSPWYHFWILREMKLILYERFMSEKEWYLKTWIWNGEVWFISWKEICLDCCVVVGDPCRFH